MKYPKNPTQCQDEFPDFVEILAQELESIQARLNELTNRGPVFGSIWSTYPENEEEIFGPLVLILDHSITQPYAMVAEASQDIDRREVGDILLQGNTPDLHFSCVLRLNKISFIPKLRLSSCAGRLSSDEEKTVLSLLGPILKEKTFLGDFILQEDTEGF
ncbi:MAG: hypothetical protein WBG50_00465 [Desulfomonilaceae bacterium]